MTNLLTEHSMQEIEQFIHHLGWHLLSLARLALDVLQIRHHMLEGRSPVSLVQQAVVDYLPQTLVALVGHFEGLLVVADHAGDLRDRSALERNVEGEHLPQDDTERVDVCCGSVLFTAKNLWRHPVRGSDLSVIISVKLLLVSRQPEITQLHRHLIQIIY